MTDKALSGNPLQLTNTPLPAYRLSFLLKMLAKARFKIRPQYLPRLFYALALSTLMLPFRLLERIRFNRAIKKTEIKKGPVFVLGFWRSGTTYLHRLLTLDRNFGYFSTFQAYMFQVFLGFAKLFKPMVIFSIPEKRPMDDVRMDADYPQEDTYALGSSSIFSFYHGWCFPKKMNFFNDVVCMENGSRQFSKEWKRKYLYVLKKITLYHKGKQVVLKNQDNTAKVKLILELFPDAKFVYITRNPYHQFLSMVKFTSMVLPRYCIQKPPKLHDVQEAILSLYDRMFKKYLQERELISAGNLVEVKYEEFIDDPLGEMKRIYSGLGLEGFDNVEPVFKEFIESQKEVKLSSYTIPPEVKEKVGQRWQAAFTEFGYKP